MSSVKTNPERVVGKEELAPFQARYEEEHLEDAATDAALRSRMFMFQARYEEQSLEDRNPQVRDYLAALAKLQIGGSPTAALQSAFEGWARDLGIVVIPHHGSPRSRPAVDQSAEKERQEKEIERLRKEVDRLTFQNELLKTRVTEQGRSLAREARNSDKLHMELVAVREQNTQFLSVQDRYLTLLSDRGRANDALVTKMAGVEDGLIRMHESYEGEVQHVGENSAVVLYNVDGQLVEQTYEKKQFNDGKLPAPGTCVKVLVFVVEYEPKPSSADEQEHATSDKPSHRKPLTGPVEF